ncbi:MAG: aspartate 1-decarboxylase [Candidatus Caenarcaniphilales bacterium]|nr:aspartate 1-decarboxylase [Candidatus Caenarcaniphilales bacterium]
MQRTILKAKIHRASVTQCDLNYEGSITIDKKLLEEAGILEFEQVQVLNINNGERIITYAIEGKDGDIGINGAAARLFQENDLVIICSYALLDEAELENHHPTIVLVDENNKVKNKELALSN